MRIGHGYDVHAFAAGRRLVLGGVKIPYEKGLLGHSDADVLCHALSDALLGAAALGDIGLHFPDTDPAFHQADSLRLLQQVVGLLGQKGYRVTNVDVTLILQRPKIAPHVPAMRRNLAQALQVAVDAVSIKATTTEELGWEGRGEGVAAHAVALIEMDGR
ncbi:2-C-methyl-D-erythritol 2,4-cyclodiphosphate synthase [bacterium]|nr:2-C-methyl-D-erythritol 2,4-cyclodiphosphate synthase [bacterium]